MACDGDGLIPNSCGYISASMLPSTRLQHSYDCRCHICYDWTKDSNTGSSDRSTASHQAYEAAWDNWTQLNENNSPLWFFFTPKAVKLQTKLLGYKKQTER